METFKKYIIAGIFLFANITLYAQAELQQITRPGPTAAGLGNFIDVPVNLYTGVPDINIPLYNFPTHSKDINVGISVNYHPAGISSSDETTEIGKGWNLFAGGMISRNVMGIEDECYSKLASPNDTIENPFDDIYNYNFMGYSGRFMIIRDAFSTFHVQMLDDSTVKVEFEFESSTYEIKSFRIFDDKGYRYEFTTYDIDRQSLPGPLITGPFYRTFRNVHHLDKVFDNNDKELVHFVYDNTVYDDGNIYTSIEKTISKMDTIDVKDIGKAVFDYTFTEDSVDSDDFKLDSITITTPDDETVKQFVFTGRLEKISEFNNTLTESKDYEFFYSEGNYLLGYTPLGGEAEEGADVYGFANWNYKCSDQANQDTRPGLSHKGALQKILLPTGGSILYDWESNTFTYKNTVWYQAESSPTEENDLYYEENQDNYEIENIDYNDFFDTSVSDTWTFTVPGTTTRQTHFYFNHTAYYLPPEWEIYPEPTALPLTYKLYSGSSATGTPLETFFEAYNDDPCYGLGGLFALAPGTYTIQMVRPVMAVTHSVHTTGNIYVSTRERKPIGELKRWVYGAGLRIKRIAHFDNDADSEWLYDPVSHPETPVKVMNYDYRMFDDASRSSGELLLGYHISWSPDKVVGASVGYTNVRVFETNNGRTDYVFNTAYHTDNDLTYYHALKSGILLLQKAFNEAGDELSRVINTYAYTEFGDYFPLFAIDFDENYLTKATWARLATRVSTSFPDGDEDHGIATTQTFDYNTTNRRIETQTTTNSHTGEILETDYSYHTGNSIHSQNRIAEPDAVQTARGATALGTSKTIYSNSWGGGNVAYLPQTIQGSKGANALENKVTVGAYDEWSNPLWIQQENGVKVHYIWGYDKTQPVAKIENLSSATPLASHITAIQGATTESALNTALGALYTDSALAGAMITTYTYLPLIGIKTMTDPKGDKITYTYDLFGRLRWVKDQDNNLLSKNEYHYK